jgi:hypothetical protein
MQLDDLLKLLTLLKGSDVHPQEIEKKKSVFEQFLGKYVLVRHHKMGVNVGTLTSYDDTHFILSESRKLWRWQAKNSIALESVAKEGVKEGTRATHTVASVIIPHKELCGIITVDDDTIQNEIKSYPVTEQD